LGAEERGKRGFVELGGFRQVIKEAEKLGTKTETGWGAQKKDLESTAK